MHTDYAGPATKIDPRISTLGKGHTTGADRPPTVIEECAGRLRGSNDRLDVLLATLRELLDDRIGPRPPQPEAAAGGPDASGPGVPSARRLMAAVEDTATLVSRLDEQVQRLREL
jgi:hypothetical protein